MEIVLLIIAGVVMYFLYNTLQDYLKNPINQERIDSFKGRAQHLTQRNDPIPQPYMQSLEDSIKHNEFAVLAAILGQVVWSDEKKCELEMCLLDDLLDDMAQEAKKPYITKATLEDIINEQKDDKCTLDELCEEYVRLTKGEYKKRLKVVEFLFALAYADGTLNKTEEECILDIAAYFEITNDDFNALSMQFEQEYGKSVPMDIEKAKSIFGIENNELTKNDLREKYEQLIKETQQNIFDNKNINKSFSDVSLVHIREIEAAYQFLLDSKTSIVDTKDAQETPQSIEINNIPAKPKNTKKTSKKSNVERGWDF